MVIAKVTGLWSQSQRRVWSANYVVPMFDLRFSASWYCLRRDQALLGPRSGQ